MSTWFMDAPKDFAPIDAKTYFYSMSFGEILIGLVYVYCGWFIGTSEEKAAKEWKHGYGDFIICQKILLN